MWSLLLAVIGIVAAQVINAAPAGQANSQNSDPASNAVSTCLFHKDGLNFSELNHFEKRPVVEGHEICTAKLCTECVCPYWLEKKPCQKNPMTYEVIGTCNTANEESEDQKCDCYYRKTTIKVCLGRGSSADESCYDQCSDFLSSSAEAGRGNSSNYVLSDMDECGECCCHFVSDQDECNANIDKCVDSPPEVCKNNVGGYTCECPSGYEGDGRKSPGTGCTDIDECARKTDNCADYAICTNTPGSFSCQCMEGYTGDGVICTRVGDDALPDECALEEDNCVEDADGGTCTNVDPEPGFACGCQAGYAGNGVKAGSGGSGCSLVDPEADCKARDDCAVIPIPQHGEFKDRDCDDEADLCNQVCLAEPSIKKNVYPTDQICHNSNRGSGDNSQKCFCECNGTCRGGG